MRLRRCRPGLRRPRPGVPGRSSDQDGTCSPGRETRVVSLWRHLLDVAAAVVCAADALLENELADRYAGPDRQRHRPSIVHLERLPIVDTRLDEAGSDVDHHANAGEPAAALQPAAYIVRQPNPLVGDAVYGLARHQHEIVVVLDRDDLSHVAVVDLFGYVEDLAHSPEDAELVVQMQVHRGRPHLGLGEWIDPDLPAPDAVDDLVVGEDPQDALLGTG